MKVSCIILFCDKDWKYLDGLVNNIRKDMTVSHEVILVDNRKDRSRKIEIDGVVLKETKAACSTIQARKQAVEFASGDYVWFIDADDEIYHVPSERMEILDGYDVIIFNYESVTGKCFGGITSDRYFSKDNNDPFSVSYSDISQYMNWNKWTRTEMLRLAMSEISDDDEFCLFEDNLITTLVQRRIKSAVAIAETLYLYHDERAESQNFSVKTLKNYIANVGKYGEFLKEHFTNEELIQIGKIDYMSQSSRYILTCYGEMDPSEKEEARLIILDVIGLNYIMSFRDLFSMHGTNENEWILSYIELHAMKKKIDIKKELELMKKILEED